LKDIAQAARDSIGSYCMTVCKSKCCRRGFLSLNDDQVATVIGPDPKMHEHRLEVIRSGIQLLDIRSQACPALTADNKCSVYGSKLRPKACNDYPLFLHGTMVVVAQDCLAVQNGLLDPYLKDLKGKGARIV